MAEEKPQEKGQTPGGIIPVSQIKPRIIERCVRCKYFLDCIDDYLREPKNKLPIVCFGFKEGDWTVNIKIEGEE